MNQHNKSKERGHCKPYIAKVEEEEPPAPFDKICSKCQAISARPPFNYSHERTVVMMEQCCNSHQRTQRSESYPCQGYINQKANPLIGTSKFQVDQILHEACSRRRSAHMTEGIHVFQIRLVSSPTVLHGRQMTAKARYIHGRDQGCEPLKKQRQPKRRRPPANRRTYLSYIGSDGKDSRNVIIGAP